VTDGAFSTQLEDLDGRGLLGETLVVWTGEMGRTPRVGQSVVGGAGAGRDGRDHWPHCFTAVLAGGGIRAGQTVGATDELGCFPVTRSVHDLQATVLHLLGLDHRRLTYHQQDRDFRLTDVGGWVVEELVA
jgi:hypothetical protein